MPSERSITAGRIAEVVGGELVGDDGVMIAGVASLDRAGSGDLSFLTSSKHLSSFGTSCAGVVLVVDRFRDYADGPTTRIIVSSPHEALVKVIPMLVPSSPVRWGIHASAVLGGGARWTGRISLAADALVGADVRFGSDCVVGPKAIIGDGVRLGDGCSVGAHALVERNVTMGHRVSIGPGTRIGTTGFGFVLGKGGAGHEKIPQIGGCVIGDDVEIGANCTIDRGSLGETVIEDGVKIDNLVHVAHNVRIGRRTLIMAQVGIAGSTTVGDDVMLAGQAGLADNLTVGRAARVAAQSGVIGDIPPGATVSGYPARDHREVLRNTAAIRRLAPLVSRLEQCLADDPTES